MLGVVNWMMASADARLVSCVQGCTWRCCPGREFSTSKSTAFRLGNRSSSTLVLGDFDNSE